MRDDGSFRDPRPDPVDGNEAKEFGSGQLTGPRRSEALTGGTTLASHRLGGVLPLVRQGLELGLEFGPRSIEALAWVAETIEGSVYSPHSLERTATGLTFVLENPPLRTAAFCSLRVLVDGVAVPPQDVSVRTGGMGPWRTAAMVAPDSSLDLVPGDRIEFALRGAFGIRAGETTIRLELRTAAIPPLVWLEFTEPPILRSQAP